MKDWNTNDETRFGGEASRRAVREQRHDDAQHMIGEEPAFYFTHVWGKGKAGELARAFRSALDAQSAAAQR